MKTLKIICRFLIFIIIAAVNLHAQSDWPVLKNCYLGQKPPGTTLEIFNPSFIDQVFGSPGITRKLCLNREKNSIITEEIVDKLKHWFPEQAENHNIPGAAIAVFTNHRVVWQKTYGKLGVNNSSPVDINTRFCIRSISKSVTALALVMAVKEGLLDLDKPITDYLPEFTVNSCFEDKPEKIMTLRHCLAHRAGFTHDPPAQKKVNHHNYFEKYIHSISDTWLRFPVGYRFAYSNLGYDLAGYILQVCSGKDFSHIVKKKVLDQLEMDQSTFDIQLVKSEGNRAEGHTGSNGRVTLRFPEMCSAGLFSTIMDMVRYAQFHLNGGWVNGKRILSDDLYKQIHSIQFPVGNQGTGYTLGLYRELVSGTHSLYHAGGGRGFRNLMIVFPELCFGVVMLTNSNDHQLTEMPLRNLIGRVIRNKLGANVAMDLNTEKLKKLGNQDQRIQSIMGSYNDGRSHIIKYENGQPVIRLYEDRCYPLVFYAWGESLMAAFDRYSIIEVVPQISKQPRLLMLSSRLYRNQNLHYVAFNDSPDDPFGPNKPEWKKYVGEYELTWEGVLQNVIKISIKNGYLYYRGRKCREFLPGLFFTNDGEAIDFRHDPPTAANLVLKLKIAEKGKER